MSIGLKDIFQAVFSEELLVSGLIDDLKELTTFFLHP